MKGQGLGQRVRQRRKRSGCGKGEEVSNEQLLLLHIFHTGEQTAKSGSVVAGESSHPINAFGNQKDVFTIVLLL